MTDFTTDTVEIPEENMDKLTKKVTQINKKAVKNGLVPMVLTVGDVIETVTPIKNAFPGMPETTYIVKTFPVTISGEWPAINGWKCIAKIDHRDGVNIVAVYDEIDVSKWRDRLPTCDHCGHNKIKVQSYLIQNEDSGEILQIGKSCIKDYIQGDPKYMLQMLDWVKTIEDRLEDEFSEIGGTGFAYFSVETVAQIAAFSIRKNGFVSAGNFDPDSSSYPTASDVNDFFFGTRDDDWKSYWKQDDSDLATAKGMIEYFNGQAGNNNFVITIKQLIDLGDVRSKFFSYIAGAVSGYLKNLDREAVKKVDAEIVRINGHVGEIKKRQDFTVVLETIITTNGYYGTTFIHKFRTTDGNSVTWFANGTKLDNEIGSTFTIKATVKKFDEYNGWKQTVVTRVKVA